jgi:hypothetical protein
MDYLGLDLGAMHSPSYHSFGKAWKSVPMIVELLLASLISRVFDDR